MAKNIIGQVSGGTRQILDNVTYVKDVKAALGATDGYTAMVNGSPADDCQALADGNFVTLAKAVKGGQA